MRMTPLSSVMGSKLAYTLFHPPRKKHHRTPTDFNLRACEATARTADGIDIHLWLIPGSGAGTAVVGHGIGLTKSASLRHAVLLHGLGYHVVLFDHRNHGLSGTDRTREHLAGRFSEDITAAIAVANDTWPASPKLVVWGFSFSTFPTLHSLRHETTPIDAIICDSGPGLDLDAMLRHHLTHGSLPGPAVFSRFLRRPAVVDAFATSAVAMLGAQWPPDPRTSASGLTPMLFLAGSSDDVVQSAQVQALASRYRDMTFIELPAGHLQGIKVATNEYTAALTVFLDSLDAVSKTSKTVQEPATLHWSNGLGKEGDL